MIGWRTIFPTRFVEAINYDLSSSNLEGSLMPLDFDALKEDQEFLYYIKTIRNWTVIFIEFHYNQLRTNIVDLQNLVNNEIELKETS